MKVLIISHNPISDQSNMGKTFLTLFSSFSREELCQIYIYPTVPNCDRCASYFRMTDKEMVNWILKRKTIGREIRKEQIQSEAGVFEEEKDEELYRNPKNKSAVRRLGRDLVWRMAKWKTAQLEQWLEQEKPKCIFVAPGVACFLYDIALYIADKWNIPIVTYICDEYYFVKQPKLGLNRMRLHILQKKIRQLMKRSACLTVISQELKTDYEAEFGIPAHVLMTGSSLPIAKTPRISVPSDAICYFGNIRCKRYLSLAEIGRELDDINKELGTSYRLKIYSAEKNEEILASFQGISSVQFCGFVKGEAFEEAFYQAPLLLHTEAFDEDSIDFVQHSVSTKIADSLASGIPLLVYAPESISSTQHALRNMCALIASEPNALRPMLLKALRSDPILWGICENALRTAREFHDTEAVSSQLYQIIGHLIDKE